MQEYLSKLKPEVMIPVGMIAIFVGWNTVPDPVGFAAMATGMVAFVVGIGVTIFVRR